MRRVNERIFTAAAAHFPLREKDIGEFATIRGRGMAFAVKAYEAPGAGSLCLLQNGGPAVNQFRKMLGDEKTAEFLRTIMFRT